MSNESKLHLSLLRFLKQLLPARDEALLVLSTAVFLVFSWSLRNLFYQIPTYVLSHNVWDLLSIVAYEMTFALLESAVVFLLFTLLAVILPFGLFRKGFAYKASLGIIALAIVSIHMQAVMNNQPKINWLAMQLAYALVGWLVSVLVTAFVPAIRKIVLDVLDRLTIFLYIYLPLGGISLLVILLRLLW